MISVLYVDRPPGFDGIRDYSDALVAALGELHDEAAQLVLWSRSRGWPAALDSSSSVILQYNPFAYGRGGFAPSLLTHLRRRRGRSTLCLMIHEPFTPIVGARSAVMGIWQRAQLRLLLEMADTVAISTEGFRRRLPAKHRARAAQLPVGSPLPDARDRRVAMRNALGAATDDLVVALYGSGHASRLIDRGVAAIAGISRAGWSPLVLNLGATAPALAALPAAARLVQPGPLDASDLAAHLAAADLVLLPFVDGASTRRTTLIAALQQQTCVLSTHGALTNGEFRDARAPILVAARDSEAFVATAIALAGDRERRLTAAAQGRALFDARFSWPMLARRAVNVLTDAPTR